MKKSFIYIWLLLGVGMGFSACSNLDESAFVPVPTEETLIYSETFAEGLGKFTVKSVSGDQKWDYYSNGYAIISGYVSPTNYENEDWLISPQIDLTNVTAAHFSFDHVARYFASVSSEATIWASEDYVNDSLPTAATWTQIKTNPFSDPGSWTFASSGEISLTQFAGKKIRIAFKYNSTATKAGTWELKNFIVKKGEAVVDKSLIFAEAFSSGLGTFSAQSVLGDQVWTGDSRGYALMSGYVSPSNFANEDWLISPEIDLTEQTAAYFSFDHVTRYFGTLASEATVLISTNYVEGAPSSATWTQLVTNPFSDPGSWTFSNSQAISLTAYAGSKVRIAFKYISTATKAGSWEIKNFQVYAGEANGVESLPYSVSEAIAAQTGANAWVEGYIVGYVWPTGNTPYILSSDSCTQMTNILIADTTVNVYASKSIAVQLPRGGIRNGLNLKTNPFLLGQKIRIKGTLTTNLGIAGIVNPTKYILADGSQGTSTTVNVFSETFATSLGNFSQFSVSGAQIWGFASGFGAKMSGYSGANAVNEDWLISPVIDLTSMPAAALSFTHTGKFFGTMKNEATLWISENYASGDPTTASWQQLIIPTYMTGVDWNFVNSGEINLDAYAGKNIRIAFKYTSSLTAAGTWEVKNFQVYN